MNRAEPDGEKEGKTRDEQRSRSRTGRPDGEEFCVELNQATDFLSVEMKPFSRGDLESRNLLIQNEYCVVRRASLWVVQAVNQTTNGSVSFLTRSPFTHRFSREGEGGGGGENRCFDR